MTKLFTIVSILFALFGLQDNSFKKEQLRYERVRQAYSEKGDSIDRLLAEKSITNDSLEVFLRAFKSEKELEVWGKNKDDQRFVLLRTIEICQTSGTAGPKRRQGDRQIPEGFYHIDRFNPWSNFYLSLGINYPNRSDRILGEKGNPGGDIFIHGSCVTIGCIPVTNDKIKELYVICVEAKNAGQDNIPVHIFPARMENENYIELQERYRSPDDYLDLWKELKAAFDLFEEFNVLPAIEFLSDGRHRINQEQ